MFKSNFERICLEKGLKPTIVVREIGLAASTFTHWSDDSVPRKGTLEKLAAALNVSVEDLLSDGTPAAPAPAFTDRPRSGSVRVPVLGNVAAGIPLEAIQDVEDWEEIPEAMAAGGEYIALRIKGHSMEPRMNEGDVVIVRLQETINSGEIAVVMVGEQDATCKKVKITDSGVMLIPLNHAYEPMHFTREEVEKLPVRIVGKVVELRAKF